MPPCTLEAGKVVAEERGVVPANQWFPEAAAGELAEEVVGLGRYGKTLTVLSVKGWETSEGHRGDEPSPNSR